MEVFGKPVNTKIEKFMDKMCQRIAAIIYIQKCYRGYYVRKVVMQKKEAQKSALFFIYMLIMPVNWCFKLYKLMFQIA